MRKFTDAVESGDRSAVEALLAENVRFTSPVAFKPYDGKAITSAILRGVLRVFDNFSYTKTIESVGGRDHALVFEATVDGKEINGCDFLQTCAALSKPDRRGSTGQRTPVLRQRDRLKSRPCGRSRGRGRSGQRRSAPPMLEARGRRLER